MKHYFTDNEDLKSEIRKINYDYLDNHFVFASDNGVFCKDRIDYGSKCLLETFLKTYNKKGFSFLDVGCGYGFMGVVISKIKEASGLMIDINKRAVHLTSMNIKSNNVNCKCTVSDRYEEVTNKYDVIITNPPIRAGKDMVYSILKEAQNHLLPDGELWFVINKDQGAKSTIRDISDIYDVLVVEKNKGFFIIRAKSR